MNLMTIFKLDLKSRIRQRLQDRSVDFNQIFFGQSRSLKLFENSLSKMEAQYIIIFVKIKCILEQVRDSQDLRAGLRYMDRVFEVSARFAVCGHDRPVIVLG